MLRILLVIHRYLAVAVGLLMALWCLSGFVMMYQPYPSFTEAERLATLAPLRLQACCLTQALPPDAEPVGDFRIEMLNGYPVLRQRGATALRLDQGTPLRRLHQDELLQVAAGYAARLGIAAHPRWLAEIQTDQWSVQGAGRNRPVQKLALGDAAGTELYLNGRSGEIFQATSRRERLLSWLGAVPHWLYPTALRRHGAVWSQVVIWSALLGTFLTATGMYVGIVRLRRRRQDGRLASPFHGWWYWHHLSGLVFGVLTLTWVFSGLLTMDPWGVLAGDEQPARIARQLEGSPRVAELRQFLHSAPAQLADGQFVQLRSQAFDGRLYVLARRADGSTLRLDSSARPAPLAESELRSVLARLDTGLRSLQWLEEEDAYYYGHKRAVPLPVYRAVLGDSGSTLLYVDPDSGEYGIVDPAARWTRWLEQGLHRLDFSGLRQRPLWDILTLLLLAGVTASCITGGWMALQRIRRDLSRS